jgi:CDP-paratose 2-epimerase
MLTVKRKSAIVTGGCGFIGTHCLRRLLDEGYRVLCMDNLSRQGAEANLDWIARNHSSPEERFNFVHSDVRRSREVENAFLDHVHLHGAPEIVIHQAGQVMVTESVTAPRADFESNALGTFNVLEAVRTICPEATVLFSSTNKVYGALDDVEVCELPKRYEFANSKYGISSRRPVAPHSPYGCSKAAADQYMQDYARTYGLRTFVFRQSCIYGTRQFGEKGQGWIAWFMIAYALQRELAIYGSGKQLRDILWIDDLLDAYWLAWHSELSSGTFNIGGGPDNTLSIFELLGCLDELAYGSVPPPRTRRCPSRLGDQLVYVSDIADLAQRFDWKPRVPLRKGVEKLWEWVTSNRPEILTVISTSNEIASSAR